MERINSLEGLRGIAAIMVLFSHLGVILYPGYYWGGLEQHSKFFEYYFGETPLGFFLSGNSGVMIFLILTGFGSYMVCNKGRERCVKYASLRFFKLSVLMFLSTITIWLLFRFKQVHYYSLTEITNTIWILGYAPFNDNILSLIFGNWFTISSNYNNTLWTMMYIFGGSIVCVLIYCLWENLRKGCLIPVGIMIGILIIMDMRYYVPCMLGYILAYCYKRKSGYSINAIAGAVILLLGSFLCGFPMARESHFFLYRFLKQAYAEYYHTVGAFLLVFVCLFCRPIKGVFENKLFLMMGKYSMSVYVVHFAVLISITSYLFIEMIDRFSYNTSALTVWGITTLTTYILAIPVKKIIDSIYKALDKGYDKMCPYSKHEAAEWP